ncbi:hypothetical protein Taro_013436 [Colocasia esculenta]|uniref:Uncharacterized protein n=1 Tax=Colocasia esculenta TaxID=4460 RepID=A0A843UIS3_COLES|nr:hypothetical protein [Colocasia esculenta]
MDCQVCKNIVNVTMELSPFGRPKKEKLEPHLRPLREATTTTWSKYFLGHRISFKGRVYLVGVITSCHETLNFIISQGSLTVFIFVFIAPSGHHCLGFLEVVFTYGEKWELEPLSLVTWKVSVSEDPLRLSTGLDHLSTDSNNFAQAQKSGISVGSFLSASVDSRLGICRQMAVS